MDGPANGAIVGVTFGGAWGIAGATALPHPWQAWSIGSSIGISAVLIVALALPHETASRAPFAVTPMLWQLRSRGYRIYD